jgi:predicted membrane-bound spermidine synthase
MAVIWEHRNQNTHYQVKTAGNSLRLYSNGIFHSQWNNAAPINGQLWELLMLPVFYLQARPLRVLLLGVGGGAVVKLLARFTHLQQLIGIELDPVHIKIAQRFFKSQSANVEYHCADAVTWVRGYKGPKFDYIIEDLFGSNQNGEVLRALDADENWLKALAKHLKTDGILCMNFDSPKQARKCWRRQTCFSHARMLLSRRNQNAIVAMSRKILDHRQFKARLTQEPSLDISKSSCKLDVAFVKLSISG